jgi:hypothetical protein
LQRNARLMLRIVTKLQKSFAPELFMAFVIAP